MKPIYSWQTWPKKVPLKKWEMSRMITDLLGLERPGILLLSHNSSEHMCVLLGQESEENPTALASEICLWFCSLGWASWAVLLVLPLVKLRLAGGWAQLGCWDDLCLSPLVSRWWPLHVVSPPRYPGVLWPHGSYVVLWVLWLRPPHSISCLLEA